jgi:hypothetical protein
LRRGEEQYKQGQGQGGRVDTAGYALLGLAAAAYPPDHTTDAVVEYLLQANADSKHWVCSSERPPTEANDVTTSALALKGLAVFVPEPQAARSDERHDRQGLVVARKALALAEVFGRARFQQPQRSPSSLAKHVGGHWVSNSRLGNARFVRACRSGRGRHRQPCEHARQQATPYALHLSHHGYRLPHGSRS